MIREEIMAVLSEVTPAALAVPEPAVRAYTGPRSLTPADVAEKTGFAVQTLANWRSLGEGPAFFKVGGLVRYDEATIQQWLESRRT